MKIVYAKNYDIIPDLDCCQIENVKRMLAENTCDTQFVFQPGVYHFYQDGTVKRAFAVSNSNPVKEICIAVLMEDMHHISLDGQGAEFIFHGDMTPIAVSDCTQIELKNFSIDFSTPLSAESRVVKVGENYVDIHIDSTLFPYVIEGDKLYFKRETGEKAPMFAAMEFDSQTSQVPPEAGDTFPKVQAFEREQDVIRLQGEFAVFPKPGNILVLRHGQRIHPGMLLQFTNGISMENIQVHQTAGLGILFQFNQDVSVLKVSFCANTAKGRRILSGHDDGLHFSNNRGKIQIEECDFRGLMDDPINVHGTAACVMKKKDSYTILGSFLHPQSVGFERWAEKGDEVAFIDSADRNSYASAKVAEYRLLSLTEFELVFETEIPESLEPNDALENLTNTPEVICRKSYFGSHRARGILVTTPKPVKIEENIFESSGAAVLLAGDVNEWYESGTCEDVLIRGNRFLNCCTSKYQFCDAVIHIEPGVREKKKAIVHRNIQIEENVFFLSADALLYADHTADIILKDNFIFMNQKHEIPKLILEFCENVSYSNNIVNVMENRDKFNIVEKE